MSISINMAAAGGSSAGASAAGRSLGALMRSGSAAGIKEALAGVIAQTPPGVVKFNPVRHPLRLPPASRLQACRAGRALHAPCMCHASPQLSSCGACGGHSVG